MIYTPVKVDDGNACTTDTCNPATGKAVNTDISCNDNNLCTVDSCDFKTGCSNTSKNFDDNNKCTTDSCDPVTGVKNIDISCSDDNSCTTDSCNFETGCAYNPVASSSDNSCGTCGDGILNTSEACEVGVTTLLPYQKCVECNITTVDLCKDKVIDDGNACTIDSCDPKTGTVSNKQKSIESDGKLCTIDSCDSKTGSMIYTPVKVDDGNACTDDSCNPETGKAINNPVSVDDNNLCTDDSCDPKSGIVHTTKNIDDSNACTTDSCDPKIGISHSDVICSDDNSCTTDSCNLASGCKYTPVKSAPDNSCGSCGDNILNSGEECEVGVTTLQSNQKCIYCQLTTVDLCKDKVIDDGNACTIDSCDPATGKAVHELANYDDKNLCTIDACDPVTGVSHIQKSKPFDNACVTYDDCDPATGYFISRRVDTDKDGIEDCEDLCPTDPGKSSEGECGCGIIDVDTDSDGIPDCNDQSDENQTPDPISIKPEVTEPEAEKILCEDESRSMFTPECSTAEGWRCIDNDSEFSLNLIDKTGATPKEITSIENTTYIVTTTGDFGSIDLTQNKPEFKVILHAHDYAGELQAVAIDSGETYVKISEKSFLINPAAELIESDLIDSSAYSFFNIPSTIHTCHNNIHLYQICWNEEIIYTSEECP